MVDQGFFGSPDGGFYRGTERGTKRPTWERTGVWTGERTRERTGEGTGRENCDDVDQKVMFPKPKKTI